MQRGIPIRADGPPAFPGPPPREADAMIVGGGIVGAMAGWFLARAGQRAVVLEKGRVGAEQSRRNWGWIRQQGRGPAELPIMIESNRIWRGLPERLRRDVGLVPAGVLYLARDARGVARHEGWMEHARAHRLDTRLARAGPIHPRGILGAR